MLTFAKKPKLCRSYDARPLLQLIAVLALQVSTANAQQGGVDAITRMRDADRQLQNEIDRARLESDRLQSEANRMAHDFATSRRLREQRRQIIDALEEAEATAAAAAKKAADEAADQMIEIEQHARKSRNNTYFGIVLGVFSLGAYALIKKHGGEKQMTSSQKDGVVTMLVSVLAMIGAVIISDGYTVWIDMFQNILYVLEVSYKSDGDYLFKFRTSYLLFILACTFTYGLTTYLQITRLRRRPEVSENVINDTAK